MNGSSWVISIAARVFVAALFVMAAVGKIEQPTKFAEEIRAYGVAPEAMTNAVALTLPWLELFLAAALFTPWRGESRWLLLAMLVFFTGLKTYAEASGLKLSCGCFSGWFAFLSKAFEGWRGVALNGLLILFLLLDWWLAPRTKRARVDATPEAAAAPASA